MSLSTLSHFIETGRESTLVILNQRLFDGVTSSTFLAVPMIVLAGEIMTKGLLIDRLLDVACVFVGHLQVGLAQLGLILVSAAITFAAVVIISGVALSFSYIVAIQNIPEIVLNVLLDVSLPLNAG